MKRIHFIIRNFGGGGAERVISLLAGQAKRFDYEPTIIVTSQEMKDARIYDKNIDYISIQDRVSNKNSALSELLFFIVNAVYRLVYKTFHRIPDWQVLTRYKLNHLHSVKMIQSILYSNPDAPVVAFLDEAILLTLLANKKNPVIISERHNVSLYDDTNDMRANACINRLYKKASCIICQTEEAAEFYRKKVPSLPATVIPNPITDGLPDAYHGIRDKKIVNFCRFSPPKNLALLLDAYKLVAEKHSDYSLYIIGSCSERERPYYDKVREHAKDLDVSNQVYFMDFRADVHEYIRCFSMFVSSSDYEGLSNSMLEAMAIGLPVVCTDCDGGGAKMMIQDHVNGLLVPKNDPSALAAAMNELIENPKLAEQLANKALAVRHELSKDRICAQWFEAIAQYTK